MRRVRPVFLVVLLPLLASAGCTYAQDPPPYRPRPFLERELGADTGAELYARDCGWCHGDRGEGTGRAPDVVSHPNGPAFTDFMLRSGRMPIDSPRQVVRRSSPVYTEREIRLLVDHVATLNGEGPDIPHPDPEAGELEEGAKLYLENCAACHSTTGAGGTLAESRRPPPDVSLGPGFIAPGVAAAPPREIAESMLVGPGTMPVFEGAFTEQEIDSITRYVLYLQEPRDRGGASIGRIGPVAEGAVAWIVGLGALIAVARWIGTRREDA